MLRALTLALLLGPPLAAQQDAAADKPPFLSLTSADGGPIFVLQMMLDDQLGMMSVTGEGAMRLTVGRDRQTSVEKAELPDGALARLELRPRAWMRAADDEVKTFVKAWGPRLAAILQASSGMPLGEAQALMGQLVAIARDVELVTLDVVSRDAASSGGGAVDSVLSVTPEDGTDLHRWTQMLVPGPQRAPLPLGHGGVMQLQVSVPGDRVPSLFEPFVGMTVAMQAAPDDFDAAAADMERTLACLDGSVAAAFDSTGMRMCFGLRDAATYEQLTTSAAAVARMQTQARRQRIESEIQTDAFAYRDTAVMKTTMVPDQAVAVLENPDGEIVSYGGAAGDVWVAAVGGPDPETRMKALIDGVLDGKLFARSAPANRDDAILSLDLDLAGLDTLLPPTMRGNTDLGGEFEHVQLSLHRTPTTLQLRTTLR